MKILQFESGASFEFEMKCPDCREVYVGERRWRYCPTCGTDLKVVSLRRVDDAAPSVAK